MAPSFDAAGWFADDASILQRVGEILLGPGGESHGVERVLVADFAFRHADPGVADALMEFVGRAADNLPETETLASAPGDLDLDVGLKENVILGHLIPAGTGFRTFQESEVRYRPEALKAMAAETEKSLVTSFPLLQDSESGNGESEATATSEAVVPAVPVVPVVPAVEATEGPATSTALEDLFKSSGEAATDE